MARSYKRKRADPPPDSEVLRCAVTEVIEKRMSLRVAASYFGLKKSTIQDYVKKTFGRHPGQRETRATLAPSLLTGYGDGAV